MQYLGVFQYDTPKTSTGIHVSIFHVMLLLIAIDINVKFWLRVQEMYCITNSHDFLDNGLGISNEE